MRILIFLFLFVFITNSKAQIVYVDKFDAVYPLPSEFKIIGLDIDNDSKNDINLKYTINFAPLTCNNVENNPYFVLTFEGVLLSGNQNKVNSPSTPSTPSILGIDCTGDTLNITSQWNNSSRIFRGHQFGLCQHLGIEKHKQGFRITKTNPVSGALGYIYGYIDYTLTNTGDIILHGWYYESSFNVPIVANSMLDYPYDGNCIHIDTVKVYDTVTTFVAVTDTLKINLNIPNSNGDISKNTVKVYPNPATTHLYIDMGTHTLLNNYEFQIFDKFGQSIYFSPIDKKEYYLDLNTFGGKGLYFLRIRNQLGVTVETKKIVLQ